MLNFGPPMVTFGSPVDEPQHHVDTDDRRPDPCIWLALVGLLCLIVAVIVTVATRNIGPTAIVLVLASLPCLGFGLGAIADENQRGRLKGVGGVLMVLGGLAYLTYIYRTTPSPCHHHHHCHCG